MVDFARPQRFRLTIVHPCVGRRIGMKRYIRTWTMEPIPAAMLAALVPRDVELRFYDDRLERIPYDEPTDLVAISVETYTARRAYQIASEFRRRRVPVVMGGFHATLCPDEVSRHCESIVLGEAERLFPQAIDDYRRGRPQKTYRSDERPVLDVTPDRSVFQGKRYLPMRLVEFSRGCRFRCDFCAIQSFFHATHRHRPLDRVLEEVRRVRRPGQMIFFIDDNITSGLDEAKELMRALIPLRIRWVSQAAIHAAFDDETLDLMRRSGCQGILIGFESLDGAALQQMNKGFNLMNGGAARALANTRRHGLSVYGTFIFGYDHDTAATFAETVEFAIDQGLFIAAFNHVTPFPGTPLYRRMKDEGRMLFDPWWLDDRYRYNMIPFHPRQMSPEELAARCVEARRRFYSWRSIARRSVKPINRRSPFVLANFAVINALHQWDVSGRNGLPLGDESWTGRFIEAQ
jgi:radical SAM superfamily enzyme YgiQ (UPF0313 family)